MAQFESAYGHNGQHAQPKAVNASATQPVAPVAQVAPAAEPDILRQPLITGVIELLGGKLMHMDEGFGTAPSPAPEEAGTAMTDTEEA